MHKTLLTLTSALLLTACGNLQPTLDSNLPQPMQSESIYMGGSESKLATQAPTNASRQGQDSGHSALDNFLAYRYNYGFRLPAKSVAVTSNSHADICLSAGPLKCQLLNASTSSHNKDNISASISLRAEPEWLERFTAEMQTSVEAVKGKMINSNVSAEDLTRQILDTDARLKAQTTLRGRLQNLITTRETDLKDLLELERELARVQGQIESATATLGVLRQRVSMSIVSINYQSQSVAVSQSALAPIGRAAKNFIGKFAYGLSGVINFFAGILPWLIFVIMPSLWIFRLWWRGRQKSSVKTKRKSP